MWKNGTLKKFPSVRGSNVAYIIDTNVAIRLRDGEADIIDKVDALDDAILMSVVTRVELEGGVYRETDAITQRRAAVDLILKAIPALTFGEEAAVAYGAIVAHAGYSRRKILDCMIAAQALVIHATLVTMNKDDFADIPGLNVLAW